MTASRPTEPRKPAAATRLVRAADAAKFLGISERKLWELAALHEIRRVRIGRAVRYDLHDLEEWIERKKRERS